MAIVDAVVEDVGLVWEPGPEEGVLQPVTNYAATGYEDLVGRLEVLLGARRSGS